MLGIRCTVFERENYLNERPHDWSFGIYWAQSSLTECLPNSLLDRLNTAQVDSLRTSTADNYMRLMNGKTAEELSRVPKPNVYRLRKSKFRALLAERTYVQVLYPLFDIERQTAFAGYLPNVYYSMAKDSAPCPTTLTKENQESQQPSKTAPKLQATC